MKLECSLLLVLIAFVYMHPSIHRFVRMYAIVCVHMQTEINFSCKHFAPYSIETLSVTEPGAHRFCLTGNPENSKDPAISSQLLGSQACTIILAFLCGNSEAKLSCLAANKYFTIFPNHFCFLEAESPCIVQAVLEPIKITLHQPQEFLDQKQKLPRWTSNFCHCATCSAAVTYFVPCIILIWNLRLEICKIFFVNKNGSFFN